MSGGGGGSCLESEHTNYGQSESYQHAKSRLAHVWKAPLLERRSRE